MNAIVGMGVQAERSRAQTRAVFELVCRHPTASTRPMASVAHHRNAQYRHHAMRVYYYSIIYLVLQVDQVMHHQSEIAIATPSSSFRISALFLMPEIIQYRAGIQQTTIVRTIRHGPNNVARNTTLLRREYIGMSRGSTGVPLPQSRLNIRSCSNAI